MKRIPGIAFACILLLGVAAAQSENQRDTSRFNEEHTEWIASVLRSVQSIKVGMTRSDLMKVFTTEGGMESKKATTSQRTYVHRECPYIKVDVKLAISSVDEDFPTDKIIEISRPYLNWSVMD